MDKSKIESKLAKLDETENQLKTEKKNLLYQQKKEETRKERRIRTHRIATKGALLEKYFECYDYSFDDTELLLKTFADFVNSNKPKQLKEKYHDRTSKEKEKKKIN